jgi:hypothetical protein
MMAGAGKPAPQSFFACKISSRPFVKFKILMVLNLTKKVEALYNGLTKRIIILKKECCYEKQLIISAVFDKTNDKH